MKILIIGGVAAGTKAAAKLKRENRDLDITIIAKDGDISYAGCGLPYYIGGFIKDRSSLIVNTPQKYAAMTGVNVLTNVEAIAVDNNNHTVIAKNLITNEEASYAYDKLIIATGASPITPPIEGIKKQGVFSLRLPNDAVNIRDYVTNNQVKKAVIVGGGFIGLEVAENLLAQKVDVTVIDFAPQIMPNVIDPEIASYVQKHLQKHGIRVLTGVAAQEVLGDDKVSALKTSAGELSADLVILSVGIRPNTAFLNDTGMEMFKGTILVNEQLQTNLPDIYAIGDCAMVSNRMTHSAQWSPMGSSANLEGRLLAQILNNTPKNYPGVLGTGIVKLPELNCARTGLSEKVARDAGYDVETVMAVVDDKAHYYPDASSFITKLIVDKSTHKILGFQALGSGAVDKMVDIAVTAISLDATIEQCECMDFCYAPPFSTAIHPFVQTVHIMQNKLSNKLISITPAEYLAGKAKDYRVIDAGLAPSIRGAKYVDLAKVNAPIEGIGKDEKLLLVCAKGKRAYFLQNRLRHLGYTNTLSLEGGLFFNDVKVKTTSKLTPEEIKAVKALGFLQDKNTEDKFNGRVITRNGKITAQESKVIAEAADKFGSGEITMTSRLTVEIQGVPYDNIEPLREYLMQNAGLETGGTGSKVRPVVSCKGTTCQYGLIDTFALSEEIHQRFYKGYRDVKLPHKFKIAVGGCPNNCVKPNLNDIGIIGQRVPQIDYAKCHGCKICQPMNRCPMKTLNVVDKKITIDEKHCNHCGLCVNKCPFHCFDNYTDGYRVYIGGRWGKRVKEGQPLSKIFTSKEEVLAIVEKAILLFREQGITGERFSDTIDRLGFANVEAQLLADDLLSRKQENLKAQKHLVGGATC